MDSKGLVCAARKADLQPHKLPFAHDLPFQPDLLSAVRQLRPTALIGVSTIPASFTPPVLAVRPPPSSSLPSLLRDTGPAPRVAPTSRFHPDACRDGRARSCRAICNCRVLMKDLGGGKDTAARKNWIRVLAPISGHALHVWAPQSSTGDVVRPKAVQEVLCARMQYRRCCAPEAVQEVVAWPSGAEQGDC